jgi:tetratricopeptide (TPR) repeat protein
MSKKQLPKTNRPVAATPVQAAPTATAPATKVALPLFNKLSVILAVISFLLFANTLQHGYVLDDEIMVKSNTIVAKGFGGIAELLTTPHMWGYLKVPNDTYRPLSLVMFAMEHQFGGGAPFVHHLFNVLTFAFCVVLLFKFLHRLMDGRNILAAFAGALIFAVLPVHTEVVANIKSRDEILCFLFAFWGLNAFLGYMKTGKTAQLVWGSIAMYLSIISKENTITLLGVVPVLLLLTKGTNKLRATTATAGTIISIILFIAIRYIVLSKYHANESSSIEFIDNALVNAPSFGAKLATGVMICGKYLQLLIVPYPLLCNYSYNAIPFASFTDIGVIASLLAYGGMIYIAITRLMKDKTDMLAFGIIFYLMTISLFTNLFILIGAEMGERFMFMPSAGLAIVIAFAVDKWLIKKDEAIAANPLNPKLLAVCLPLVVIYGSMAYSRNKDWGDNVNLYRIDLVKSPNDCRLNYYLGTALAENLYNDEPDPAKKKEIDMEAIGHLRKSLTIYDKFSEAYAELGRIYDREQRYDSAEYYDKLALQLNPGHVVATNNLGSVYLASGKYAEAAITFRKAIAINPEFDLAYFNLARTYNQLKQYDSAIFYYGKMLELRPGYIDAYQETGMAYFSKGDYPHAEGYFKKVLELKPDEASAINNLGAIYLNNKNYAQAINYLNKSIQLNPNYLNAYSNLGRAYFFNKNFKEAIETFNRQISLNNKAFENIPYIALSYQGMGNMAEARKYEAIARQYYSNFKLD